MRKIIQKRFIPCQKECGSSYFKTLGFLTLISVCVTNTCSTMTKVHITYLVAVLRVIFITVSCKFPETCPGSRASGNLACGLTFIIYCKETQ